MKINQRGLFALLLSVLGKMNQYSSSEGEQRSEFVFFTFSVFVCVCFIFCSHFSLFNFRGRLWNPGDLETLDGIHVSSQMDMTKRKTVLKVSSSYHKGEPDSNTLYCVQMD